MSRAIFCGYPPFKGGSVHWRVLTPANMLGGQVVLRETTGKLVAGDPPEDVAGKLVIYQQPTVGWHLTEISKLKTAGAKVVINTDDALWAIRRREDHIKRKAFTKKVADILHQSVTLSDGLVVTTQFLADRLKKYQAPGAPTWVIPNAMDLDRYDFEYEHDGKLRIGFEGSTAHRDSLLTIMPAVIGVMRKFPDVWLRFAGDPYDDLVPEDLADRVEWAPFTHDLVEYPKLIRPIDIGLAPSLDNDFYRAKSPLRIAEYGMAGAAVVATGPTYRPGLVGAPPLGLAAYSHVPPEGVGAVLDSLVSDETYRSVKQRALSRWVRSELCVDAVKPLWEGLVGEMLDGGLGS